MSLTVHARRRVAERVEGSEEWETPASPHNELAGFESWRTSVWGSEAVKQLGLTLLPSLAVRDLYVSGQALDDLDEEVRTLQDSLRSVVNALLADGVHIVASVDPYETVRSRLANIAEAVRLARAFPEGIGEVVIW
jgi:hypothetical protein